MALGVIPVWIASPNPAAYRLLPGHRSRTIYVSINFDMDIMSGCTFARSSASGMSLSASLVKSFSGFSRPDMMTNEAGGPVNQFKILIG